MKDFFIDKFEFDFYANKSLCLNLLKNENQLNDFILRSTSHIINIHHIWNARLLGELPESNEWDKLPIDYFLKLNQSNYLTTIDYLENLELNEKVNYHDSEGILLKKNNSDILYHILNHSTHHRAQISLEMNRLKLLNSSSNFIVYK